MAHKYPSNRQHCATCTYWTGRRETNYFGDWLEVDDPLAKGKCMCRGNIWFNVPCIANSYCSSYKKWEVLK